MLKKSHLLKMLLSVLFIALLTTVVIKSNNRLSGISLAHAAKLSKEKKCCFSFVTVNAVIVQNPLVILISMVLPQKVQIKSVRKVSDFMKRLRIMIYIPVIL